MASLAHNHASSTHSSPESAPPLPPSDGPEKEMARLREENASIWEAIRALQNGREDSPLQEAAHLLARAQGQLALATKHQEAIVREQRDEREALAQQISAAQEQLQAAQQENSGKQQQLEACLEREQMLREQLQRKEEDFSLAPLILETWSQQQDRYPQELRSFLHKLSACHEWAQSATRATLQEMNEENWKDLARLLYATIPGPGLALVRQNTVVSPSNVSLLWGQMASIQSRIHERLSQLEIRVLCPAPGDDFDVTYHASNERQAVPTSDPSLANTIESLTMVGFVLMSEENGGSGSHGNLERVLLRASVKRYVN